jgi:valyl-tRNA synthetase
VTKRLTAMVEPPAAEDAPAGERERLEKELAQVEARLESARARLADPAFAERAPAHVVDGTRRSIAELEDQAARLRERLGG